MLNLNVQTLLQALNSKESVMQTKTQITFLPSGNIMNLSCYKRDVKEMIINSGVCV